MTMRLLLTASAGTAFVDLATRQLDRMLARAGDLNADPAGRIHDVRSRSKRLRALLRMVEPAFPDFDRVDDATAKAARLLAGMRDARVLRDTLRDLYDWAGRETPQDLRDSAGASEQAERAALLEFGTQVQRLAEASRKWHVDGITHGTLVEGLAATYRRARKARRKADRSGNAADFHRWRRHTKYHFYQLDFLKDAAPDILAGEVRAAKELGRILGRHHDLDMLRTALASSPDALGMAVDVEFVEQAGSARQRELAALGAREGDQLFAEKPRAFGRRVGAYFAERPNVGTTSEAH